MSATTMNVESKDELSNNTLALILAGGKGTRLFELTTSRAKPALTFGGKCCVIDFPLSNCVNSGIKKIGVLTHYQPSSLIKHIASNWNTPCDYHGEMVEILQSTHRSYTGTYEGTANAVYQNIAFIRKHHPKFVAILAGDHVYKMDYTDMLACHAKSGADMTISCIEVPLEEAAGKFGVMSIDSDDHIVSFEEKPTNPLPLADKPGYVLASMGNYIFNTDFLIDQLLLDANDESSEHDFGKNVIPSAIKSNAVLAYRYKDIENNPQPYWRDVGTIESFWQTHMDLLESQPKINISDSNWPISYSKENADDKMTQEAHIENKQWRYAASIEIPSKNSKSLAKIIRTSLPHDTVIGHDTVICESVILPKVKIGNNVIVYRAIIDEGCDIPDGAIIGVDHELDCANGFRVSERGIVLVTDQMIRHYCLLQKSDIPVFSTTALSYVDESISSS
jgi:glucose-1-phosphate adenylyltransferase